MNETAELIFARKALASIVDEVEDLRRQLAAAEARVFAAERWQRDERPKAVARVKELEMQLAAAEASEAEKLLIELALSEVRREKAHARAAAEGDRAADLETELQHCKAKREQAEERGQLCLDALAMKTEELEARAEAAKAALEEARYGADSLRLELGLAEARWQKAEAALERAQKLAQLHSGAHDRCCEERRALKAALARMNAGDVGQFNEYEEELQDLRRVAEAVSWDGKLAPVHLRTWADSYERDLGYDGAALCVWLRNVAAALAAWDEARVSTDEGGKGGDEDGKE